MLAKLLTWSGIQPRAGGHGSLDEHIELGFDDVDLALIDGVDGVLVDVDADDFFRT